MRVPRGPKMHVTPFKYVNIMSDKLQNTGHCLNNFNQSQLKCAQLFENIFIIFFRNPIFIRTHRDANYNLFA